MEEFIKLYREELIIANAVLAINFLITAIALLPTVKRSNRASLIFFLIFLFTGLRFLASLLEGIKAFRENFPHIIDANLPLALSIPILFYLYLLYKFDVRTPERKEIWYHFILPVAVTICYSPFYLRGKESKLELFNSAGFNDVRIYTALFVYAFSIYYLTRSLILFSKVRAQARETSYALSPTIIWTFRLYVVMLLLYLALFANLFSIALGGDNVALIAYLGYFITYLVLTFLLINRNDVPFSPSNSDGDKDQKNELREKDLETIAAFDALMQKEQFYIDENCNLTTCAEKLDTTTRRLSLVIKAHFGFSVNHIINNYRIQKAKEILLSDEDVKIEAVGYDVGYSTRSAFYRNFNKYAGVNPGKFKENHQKETSH